MGAQFFVNLQIELSDDQASLLDASTAVGEPLLQLEGLKVINISAQKIELDAPAGASTTTTPTGADQDGDTFVDPAIQGAGA